MTDPYKHLREALIADGITANAHICRESVTAILSSHDALRASHDILTRTVLDALARHGVTYVDDPGEAIDSLMAGKVREVEASRLALHIAIEFDGEDESGEPAVWLDKARATLTKGEQPLRGPTNK